MGEVFAGRFELIDLIGEGGMGTVWRARDLRRDTIVAAKVLRQSHAAALLRFVREQAIRVHHPHIVVPLGWAGEDDRVVFTMPLVGGGSVATLIGDFGALPPLYVAEILRQVIDAVGAVHAQRLVHRDIKPANILLDVTGAGRPHAYLSDFGIAIDLDSPRWTHTGVVTGTPGYLAPELETDAEVGFPADLFSVGMVGAAMLTGLRPSDIDLAVAPPGVPNALWSLVRDLGAADPASRPGVADALARLDHPSVAWRPDAVGDVEVFDHLPPLPGAPEAAPDGEVRVATAPQATSVAPPVEAPTTRPMAAGRPGRGRDLAVLAVLALMFAVGLALLWPTLFGG